MEQGQRKFCRELPDALLYPQPGERQSLTSTHVAPSTVGASGIAIAAILLPYIVAMFALIAVTVEGNHPRSRNLTMRDFFKPLRRKIGVVTLGLACVLMAGWVRSFDSVDFIDFHYTDPTFAVLSQNGVVSFSGLAFRSMFTGNTRIYLIELRDDPDHFADFEYACQYVWIVGALVLLSAWLLLSKPQPAKPPSQQPT